MPWTGWARQACLGLAALVMLAAGVPSAWADPFAWEEAEVRVVRQALRGGGVVTVRLGTIAQGGRLDSAVVAEWSGREPVELLREMTDSKPVVEFAGGVLRVRWVASPAGAARRARVERCWRLARDERVLVAGACGVGR